jgi:hypothetical protein
MLLGTMNADSLGTMAEDMFPGPIYSVSNHKPRCGVLFLIDFGKAIQTAMSSDCVVKVIEDLSLGPTYSVGYYQPCAVAAFFFMDFITRRTAMFIDDSGGRVTINHMFTVSVTAYKTAMIQWHAAIYKFQFQIQLRGDRKDIQRCSALNHKAFPRL